MSAKGELSARAQAILEELTYPSLGPDDITIDLVLENARKTGHPISRPTAYKMLEAREQKGILTRFYTISEHTHRRIVAWRVTAKDGVQKKT
jgi:Fe2+ or Zn2+ uptake regulation protein